MMTNKTIAYFLLLPIWVMVFHAVVPHHHHLDSKLTHNSLEHSHQHHKDDCHNTEHCHAFNETTFFINKQSKSNKPNKSSIASPTLSVKWLWNEQETIKEHNTPLDIALHPQEYHLQNPFRGPPRA